jgi:outer membrane immunogenic protein
MNKLAICVIAISGLIGTSAFAADMGVPAAPPPAPVWNWTGWYAGVNLGASMGTVKTTFNAAPVTVVTNIPGLNTFNAAGFGGSNTESPDGFIGGGQIGYNWQFSPIWVVGFEADFQGSVEKDHNTLTNPFSFSGSGTPAALVNGTTVIDYSTKIDWFGTARLRAGYVWGNGNVFTYVTGGLAYGKVDVEGTSTVSGTITNLTTPPSLAFATAHAIGHSDVNTGWVLGYGTEGRLGNSNWTWKIENLYMDLGHLNDTDVALTTVTCRSGEYTVPCTANATGGQTFTNTHFTDWILRGGLNYKFY